MIVIGLSRETASFTVHLCDGREHGVLIGKLRAKHISRTPVYKIFDPHGSTAPEFRNGYLIQFKHHTSHAGQPNVYLFNYASSLSQQISLWPEDTATLLLLLLTSEAPVDWSSPGSQAKQTNRTSALSAPQI